MICMKISGQKIRQIRQALELSTVQVAAKANLTRQAVEAWERNGVKNLTMLKKIADILGVPEKLLLEDDSQP